MAATMDRQDCNRNIQGMDGTKWDGTEVPPGVEVNGEGIAQEGEE